MNMLKDSVLSLLERDIDKLRVEIESYSDEGKLWKVSGSISNTSGNLCLHLVGNLNHYIGAVLGNTGYVRNRDEEFATKGINRKVLINMIMDTRGVVREVLARLDESILEEIYPIQVFGEDMTTGYFLIHLCTHFNYHLGQINYHRRILDKV